MTSASDRLRHIRRRDQHADAHASSPTRASATTRFHTTSICSPTRAALLTGRNHQRVGNWHDRRTRGGLGRLYRHHSEDLATMAEVLRDYGYKTAAIGKWHNTPADQTPSWVRSIAGRPGYGFDYFYGFLAGETSQWEPRLVENTNQIEPPHDREVSPERGSRPTRRSTGCVIIRRSRPTSRSSCTGRRAPGTGRITSSRSGPTSTRASSTTAGMPIASACSHAPEAARLDSG